MEETTAGEFPEYVSLFSENISRYLWRLAQQLQALAPDAQWLIVPAFFGGTVGAHVKATKLPMGMTVDQAAVMVQNANELVGATFDASLMFDTSTE